MFEIIHTSFVDEKDCKARVRYLKDKAPLACIKFDEEVHRYYVCLGTYSSEKDAVQAAMRFLNNGINAGVRPID